MNQDARITEGIIKRFLAAGRPILSIHDSYIVTFGDDGRLHDAMYESFEEVTNVRNVKLQPSGPGYHKVIGTSDPNHRSELADTLLAQVNQARSPGYLERLSRFHSH